VGDVRRKLIYEQWWECVLLCSITSNSLPSCSISTGDCRAPTQVGSLRRDDLCDVLI